MKKYITLAILLLIISNLVIAQSIKRNVIGASGMTSSSGNLTLSATTGESATNTLNSGAYQIRQGFQQYKTKVRTSINFILYLQGYYSALTHSMQPVLFNEGITTDNTIADSILVELRYANSPTLVASSKKFLLSTSGNSSDTIISEPGNYYVVIKHRNSLETWSAIPYLLNGQPIGIDFSYEASRVYESNQVEVEPGVWAFYSGDINQDKNIDLLDLISTELDVNQFLYGYYPTDINGDGNVDLLDIPIVETNLNNFIYARTPE